MREMKDSRIDYLGKINSRWNVTKLRYICQKLSRGFQSEATPLICSNSGKVFPRGENNYGLISDNDKMYQGVHSGDLLIHGMDTWHGAIAVSDYNGKCTTVVHVCDSTESKQYICYYLQMLAFKGVYKIISNGVRENTSDFRSWEKAGHIYIALPCKEEQEKIADYLKTETSKIDALIMDIQSQIETLEEYKRSVITEAVTKGLDPDVEMRDSGVQWIGMIPKHWTVDNPKWHFVQRKDRATKGLTQLTASQKYGVVTQEEYMEITGAKVVTVEKDFDILKLVCPGDFIIHMRSFQGGLEYSEKYGSISSAYVMLIPQKTILEPRFYKWFFKSPVYIDALSSTSNLIRDGQAMRYANFIQLPIPLMPKEEQQQIADYLDMKCAEIDSIIAEKKQQIETIEEYKKSLIFEYVTGKKEVATSENVTIISPEVLLSMALIELGDALKGKIHAQKAIYMCEMMLKTRPNAQYYKYEHGPYDKNLDKYISKINQKQWFVIHDGSPMTCKKGKNFKKFCEKYKDIISNYKSEVKKIVDFIKPMKTSQAERVATLFAVWNDLIIDGIKKPTDTQIINEVINNWTPNKKNSDISTWENTLKKMKTAGIIPTGFGLHTKPKEC